MTMTTLSCAIPRNQMWTVLASDEQGNTLDQVALAGATAADTLWGSFVWGGALWNGAGTFFVQHPLPWDRALVFKQASLRISGNCALGMILGNFNMQIAKLGYLTQYPQVQPAALPPAPLSVLVSDSGIVLTDDSGRVILMSDETGE